MNTKGIKPLEDEDICLICQKKKATHIYSIYGRGYGSSFDGDNIEFKCCDECNKPEFEKWFGEKIQYCCPEEYLYENYIWDLFKSLPLNSQERIFNTNDYIMESQDWIDYELDELPHEKCKEYGRYSPQEIQAYYDRFPICAKVYKNVYSDGSAGCWCDCGAHGKADGNYDPDNICEECYMCTSFEKRTGSIKEINVSEEQEEREKQRLKEMLDYAVKHLNEMGVDVEVNVM